MLTGITNLDNLICSIGCQINGIKVAWQPSLPVFKSALQTWKKAVPNSTPLPASNVLSGLLHQSHYCFLFALYSFCMINTRPVVLTDLQVGIRRDIGLKFH